MEINPSHLILFLVEPEKMGWRFDRPFMNIQFFGMNNYEYSTIWLLGGAEKRAGDNSETIFFFLLGFVEI
jgi:hypothetical protein